MGGTKCLLSPTPKNMGGTCPPVPHPNKAHACYWPKGYSINNPFMSPSFLDSHVFGF